MSDLPFKNDWRSRWVQVGKGSVIHRVKTVNATLEEWLGFPYAPGTTLCGLEGHVSMPGIFSRMGAPRCKKCCARAGVPQGAGAPFNEGIDA